MGKLGLGGLISGDMEREREREISGHLDGICTLNCLARNLLGYKYSAQEHRLKPNELYVQMDYSGQ